MNCKKPIIRNATILMAPFALALAGCGGGGGGGGGTPPPPEPTGSIVVQPESFDFGLVTEGNLDEIPSRRFSIENTGSASYSVSSVRLEGADPGDFELDENAVASPCGPAVFSLSPGASCDVEIRFAPGDFGSYGALLVVQSDDPVAPTVNSALQATYAEVEAVNVTVNQIQACPRGLTASAYVSVTDQGGFPIRDLGLPDFALEELGNEVGLDFVDSVGGAGSTLSLSIVMDYSGSIADNPVFRENMEAAAKTLVEKMREQHEADIIKFAREVRPMLPDFTSDKAALLAAIDEDPGVEGSTSLYLAILEALDRIRVRTTDRKVVVSLTDGLAKDTTADIETVIDGALEDDVPVFTVGFGDVDDIALTRLADETGGNFYSPAQSENLEAVYQQLANLLFDGQYVLSFQSGLASDASGAVQVSVDFVKDGIGFQGSGTKTSLACPSP